VSAVANQQLLISVLNQELHHSSSQFNNSSTSRASVHFAIEETSLTIRPRIRTWTASEMPKPAMRRTRRPSIAIDLVDKRFVECRKCVFAFVLFAAQSPNSSFIQTLRANIPSSLSFSSLQVRTANSISGRRKEQTLTTIRLHILLMWLESIR
jgi:hypothetical protein